jgi:hypothetical protein
MKLLAVFEAIFAGSARFVGGAVTRRWSEPL